MDGFRITVDDAHVKAHNEYFRDSRRLRTSAAIMAVLSAAAAVAVVAAAGPAAWTWIAAAVLALFAASCAYVLVTLPRQIGTPQQLYDRWPLVPAVVAEVNPRDMTLLALVDVSRGDGRPRPALATRTVTAIPGVPRRTGARVPAIAVCGRHAAGDGAWDEVTPVPLAWGTPDRAAIADAEARIGADAWSRLASLADRAPEVRGTRRGLLEL